MKTLRRTYPFDLDVRATKPDGSYFEGHCAVFNGIDEYGTIMARGCFSKNLSRFLARGFIGGLNHNWNEPVGSPQRASEDEIGLFVAGNVLETSHGMDLRILLANKVCKFLSFGFCPQARMYLEKAEDVAKFWEQAGHTPSEQDTKRAQYGALVFTEIEVYEASPVMVPGNQEAEITSVRGDGALGRQTLEDHLLSVRAAVEVLSERFVQLATLRAEDARSIPPERRTALRAIRDMLDRALAAAEPKADPADVRKLRADLLRFQARPI